MDHHDGNYFTIFYGVYQRSTVHPALCQRGTPARTGIHPRPPHRASSQSFPLGMFEDTFFTATNLEMLSRAARCCSTAMAPTN